mmetsp:Transcript_34542/g.50146  ORF Transcript_34542/g.50146 Transcript_34542/m.50146 type:complete len:1105 (+) Transcript_34542:371-3685(+)
MEAAVDDEDEDDDEGEAYYQKEYRNSKRAKENAEREQLDAQTREMMRQQDRRRAAAGGFFTSLESRARSSADNDDDASRNNNTMSQLDRRRRHGGIGGGRSSLEDDEEDEERSVAHMARSIEERHRQSVRRVDLDAQDARPAYVTDYSAVSQQSLVPSVSDPSLWMLGCAPGKEAEMVMQIMNKCVAFALQGKTLGITGAVAAQSKGKIYIESYSEPAVMEAVQGVRGLLQYQMRLIPIGDMTTVMTVTVKKKPVKKNDWVRLSRGHFKGDLALVVGVKDGGLKCIVQCVPRLDYSLADLTPEEAKVRRRTVRPPQKFFNPSEIMDKHALSRQRFPGLNDTCDYYEGNYYHDGYMLKEVKVGTMVKPCGAEDPPTLEELQRFRRRPNQKKASQFDDVNGDDDDEFSENAGSKEAESLLEQLASQQQQQESTAGSSAANGGLIVGDTIEVIDGDLVGMRGKLISLDGNTTVKVKPMTDGIEDTAEAFGDMTEIEFLMGQVRKYIPTGAHVKVMDGRYANETGTVVAIDDSMGGNDCLAVVLTDLTHKEISVRTSQLQESAEIASGQDKLAGYELHDLVVLSGGGSTNEVGVIVRVGREEFTVINNHGIVREVRPEELRGKRNSSSRRAVALDVQGNQIRVGDSVNVAEGPHKGKTATIKQMNRAQLFLYSQTRTEHAGIFVVRSRSCVLSGARNRSSMETANANGNGFKGGGGAGGRGIKREDGLIGKTVRVSSGQWKGYIGTVADATATHVSVELHSRLKKVMVLRERVAVVGDKYGSTDNPDRQQQYNGGGMAPTTPFLQGGATPMHGGATPMHGGVTPMHEGGMGGGGGFTPSHHSAADAEDVWRPGSIDQTPKRDENNNGVGGVDGDGSSTFGSFSDASTSDAFAGVVSGSISNNKGNAGGMSGTTVSTSTGWGSSSVSDQSTLNTWTPQSSTADPSPSPFADNASVQTAGDISTNGGTADLNGSLGGGSASTDAFAGKAAAGVAAVDSSSAETAVWFMERVVVELKSNGQPGTIKEVNSDNSARLELEGGEVVTIHGAGEVKLVAPKEHDTVLVTGGADVGVEGELVCIDGSEAILKDGNEDFKIVDLEHLAKIAESDAM